MKQLTIIFSNILITFSYICNPTNNQDVMNIEDFREYCLSLKGVTDKMPFGKAASEYDRNLLVFSVADKWFCFVNVDVFDFCVIKCDADRVQELQALHNDIKPAYHMNKKHWISVCFNRELPDSRILELVRDAYELVAASLPRKEKERLQL